MTPQHIAPTPEQTPAERLREVVRGIMAAIEPLYAATIDLVTELVHERFPTASTLSVYGEYNEESNLRVRVASIRVLREDDDAYTIDVETNSTVDSEATTEKQETAEFMNAFGQAMSGLKDLMMTPEGFEAGKTILIGITSKFRLGEDVDADLVGQVVAHRLGRDSALVRRHALAEDVAEAGVGAAGAGDLEVEGAVVDLDAGALHVLVGLEQGVGGVLVDGAHVGSCLCG